jgi:hypothetical protein
MCQLIKLCEPVLLLQSRHEEFEEKRRRQLEEEEEAARRAAEFKVNLHLLSYVCGCSHAADHHARCKGTGIISSIYLRLLYSLASTLDCLHCCRSYTYMFGSTARTFHCCAFAACRHAQCTLAGRLWCTRATRR